MAEQLSLEDLPRALYKEALRRALAAGVPESWIAEALWSFHRWWPNPPPHILEYELALLAERAGVDFARSAVGLAEDSSAARRLAPPSRWRAAARP